jgi:hypothetical protein
VAVKFLVGASQTDLLKDSRRRLAPSLLATFVLNGFLLTWTEQTNWLLLAQASISLWLVWISYFFWRRSESLPLILPLYCAVYWAMYLAPAFTSDFLIRFTSIPADAISSAATLALAGHALFLAGFVTSPVKRVKAPAILNVPIDLRRSKRGLFAIAIFIAPLKLLLAFVQLPSAISQMTIALADFGVISMAGLFLLQLRGQLSAGESWLLNGTIAMFVFVLLVSGFMALPLSFIAVFVAVYVSKTRKVPLLPLLLALIPLLIFSQVKAQFRKATWSDEAKPVATGLLDSAELLFNLSTKAVSSEDGTGASEGSSSLLKRVDHLTAFGLAIDLTPGQVPFWAGETYLTLLTSPIPRFVWPGKPEKTLGQDYGHRYGYLDPTDHYTSINLEQTVEMYANFGPWGVLLGMLGIGMLYRAVFSVLSAANDTSLLISVALLPQLLLIECDFSLVHGALAQVVLFWAALFHICRWVGILVPNQLPNPVAVPCVIGASPPAI